MPVPAFDVSYSTAIIACGISRKEDGEYYCPYCDFSSYDIEDFATSMCWDCVYNFDIEKPAETKKEETVMGDVSQVWVKVNGDEVNPGDKLRATREFEVSKNDTAKGVVFTKDRREVRYAQEKSWSGYDITNLPVWTLERVKTIPAGWPVEQGDVWRDKEGKEYHAIRSNGNGIKMYSDTDIYVTMTKFENIEGLELKYRKNQ